MSNSSLVSFTRISPNRTSPRNHIIDTVSIHCMAGKMSAQSLGEMFSRASTQASSNYCVDANGKIGLFVDENDRSWCTSSRDNDNRAITIEVASASTHPYAVDENVYESLINLLVDICKRNPGIGRLRWEGDRSLIGNVARQNMTVHRWFANKACPGDYLYSRHFDIVNRVNARLDKLNSLPDVEIGSPSDDVIYRVRKTWADAKSQIGAYRVLENARRKVIENPGYSIFDTSGKCVYPVDLEPATPVKTVAFAQSKNAAVSGNYEVVADNLNLRYQPGVITSDNVVDTIPKGTVVRNYGYFTEVDRVKWLLVAHGDKTGFVHSEYVEKI